MERPSPSSTPRSKSQATVSKPSPRSPLANPSSSARTAPRNCRGCGAPLAHDHVATYCSPCIASRRDYNPCCDPTFGEQLLGLLTANVGQPVHVHRDLGIEHCGRISYHCVLAHVRRLRRHGYVIEGSHAGTWTLISGVATSFDEPG